MELMYKEADEGLTEEFLEGLIGKYVHAPTNKHVVFDSVDSQTKEVNVWFAGRVAGYRKTVHAFDYREGEFLDESVTVWQMLLADGAAYYMAESIELREITPDTFQEMLAESDGEAFLDMLDKEKQLPNLDLLN